MAITIQSTNKAKELLQSIDGKRLPLMKVIREYQRGDHWQKATGWGGPPLPEDGITSVQAKEDQTPIPVIDKAIERYVTGMIGDEPAFEVTLVREVTDESPATPEELAEMAEFNEVLTHFWDGRGVLEKVQDALENLCSGRGTLRPFIPPESPIITDAKRVSTLTEAMDYIHLEAPSWEQCGVFTDVRSMREIGIYLYDEQYIDSDGATRYKPRVEITELDDNKNTLFRVIEGGQSTEDQTYDCNGNIWVFQAIDDKPLIREPQRKLQRAIDFLNTIIPKNATYAGFRERHFINVKQPMDENGKLADPQMGPTTVNFWQPTVTTDSEGNQKAAPATLILSEPVNSQPIRDDITHMIYMFLKSVHQDDEMMNGDAVASAVSRVQARAGFANSLLRNKPKVERMLRDMLMTVLCLACELSGEKGKLQKLKTDYRIRVDVKPNSGPLSPEEELAVVSFYEKGVISRETAQVMLGVEDVEGEAQKLREEQETSQIYLQNQATIMQTVAVAGAHLENAAIFAGVDKEEAKKLGQGDFVGGEDDNTNNESGAG